VSYSRLEDIMDLNRLCEARVELFRTAIEGKPDKHATDVAMTVLEVRQDRMRELKATYYAWHSSPLKDGDDHKAISSCAPACWE
jgi:hypothetical protein